MNSRPQVFERRKCGTAEVRIATQHGLFLNAFKLGLSCLAEGLTNGSAGRFEIRHAAYVLADVAGHCDGVGLTDVPSIDNVCHVINGSDYWRGEEDLAAGNARVDVKNVVAAQNRGGL